MCRKRTERGEKRSGDREVGGGGGGGGREGIRVMPG